MNNLSKIERFSDNQLMLNKANNYQSNINKIIMIVLYFIAICIILAIYYYIRD